MTFLGEKACADLHVLTVEVLSLCLAEASSTTALQGSNCLEKLLVNITESSDPIMKKNATRTLASAALDGEVFLPVNSYAPSIYFHVQI